MSESYKKYFVKKRKPLPGDILFDALQPPKEIILAANTRATIEVVEGILLAAKETKNIVILELALSEMDEKGGYTGLTPSSFAVRVKEAAKNVGWNGYVLHADHITVKKGTIEELERVQREIDARVDAGFNSYAIDSSYLFDRSAYKVEFQLKDNLKNSILLFEYIKEKMGKNHYGKEGEVGEIGITEYTTIEEASYFLNKLKENDIRLNCLAIANGSKHGVSVDAEGKVIPQLNINIKRTVEIVDALRAEGFKTGIAQHGITGTPIPTIASKFPKGKIIKGNVGTWWMLLVWDVLQIYEPALYEEIYKFTIDSFGKIPSEAESFIKNSKYAIKEFFDNLEKIGTDTKRAIRARAYSDALMFYKAFNMEATAEKVYRYIVENQIKY